MEFFSRQFPSQRLRVEPNYTSIDKNTGITRLVRADLAWKTDLDIDIIIDFDVTNPAAGTFIAIKHCAHLRPDRANAFQEEIKMKNYKDVVPEINDKIIIFSVEATGRIGIKARQFLERLLPTPASGIPRYKALLKNIETTIMKHNARMVINSLEAIDNKIIVAPFTPISFK